MPAHVTLLVPFVDGDALGAGRVREVGEVLARFEPIELSLAATAFFEGPPRVLYLEPRPVEAFKAMTNALVRAFPDYPPYGDAGREIVPHLTVATRLPYEDLTAIEAEVAAALPITARPAEAWLMEYAGERWHLRARFAFEAA
jgi:2'-5' RNA ligase